MGPRVVFLCALGLHALVPMEAKHPIRQSLASRINKKNLGWVAYQAAENPLAGLSESQIQGRMGLRSTSQPGAQRRTKLSVETIPDAFDARTKFASCAKGIRDQAHCGSCWAFGAAETLTDNLCVLGLNPPVLSPQDLVSCDAADHGCQGGTLPSAWDFIDSHGLVSDECIPYASGDGSNHSCPSIGECTGEGDTKAFKCPVTHSMLESDEEIQAAVMTVGAVEVGFTVFEDFMNYKSGVYKYSEGMALGGHAVKIVGWGEQGETFFWIVQNSWGASWGESGYFKIVSWHEDKNSAIGIGGGFACVQGAQPAPPSPAPAPSTCADIAGYCSKYGRSQCAAKSYLVPVCLETCGCCDDFKPSYCPKDGFEDVVVV